MARSPVSQRNDLQSFVIPNLVQGVSQQAAEQRRDTQCESQFDCINSPVNGCEARPPLEVIGLVRGARFENAFCRQIARGSTEHYLAVFANDDPSADRIRVFDLNNGQECEVTFTAPQDYLSTDETPRDKLRGATLEDFTFIANREIKPRMDAENLAEAGYNEGIVYFKAGGYKITFQVAVNYNGNTYTFTYVSPDNSTAANAGHITTNNLAATMFRAMAGGAAVPKTSGNALVAPNRTSGQTSYGGGVGAASAGETTGVTATTNLISLGFYLALNGNVILIGRADDEPFSIDTSDGVGDTYLRSVKGQAQNFSDLPRTCFVGFTCSVKGSNSDADDDYWVTFKERDGTDGYWQETVMPGAEIDLDPEAMPHALVNTGYQEFEWKYPDWQPRVSGDGETNSKDPSFVGKEIQDIFYSNARLGILTEGSCVWAVNANPFTFFPASAQTILDTDPVDTKVGGGKEIALLRKAVQIKESTFLWAEKVQFKVNNNNDIFKQDSVQADKSTEYEFSSLCDPTAIGGSLYFVTEPGEWSSVIDLTVQDGKPQGDTDVTGHVKKYVPSRVRHLVGSTTLGIALLQSDRTPNQLYCYNYLLSREERLQSAWNTWRFPTEVAIKWVGIRANKLLCLLQWGDWGALICKMDLGVDATDPGFSDYMTRADMRLPEGLLTVHYDEANSETKILLPFTVPSARGYVDGQDGADGTNCPLFVVTRETSENTFRGNNWQIKSILWDAALECDVITVAGDATGEALYVGHRITAERTEGEFFLRSPQQGAIDVERLQIVNCVYTYSNSGYWRAEVTSKVQNPKTYIYNMSGRIMGSPLNVLDQHPIIGGKFKVPIAMESGQFTLRLVNDTFLPSRWTRCAVQYKAGFLASPSQFGARSNTA